MHPATISFDPLADFRQTCIIAERAPTADGEAMNKTRLTEEVIVKIRREADDVRVVKV